MHKDEEPMLGHLKDSLEADYADRTRADVDKLMTDLASVAVSENIIEVGADGSKTETSLTTGLIDEAELKKLE